MLGGTFFGLVQGDGGGPISLATTMCQVMEGWRMKGIEGGKESSHIPPSVFTFACVNVWVLGFV